MQVTNQETAKLRDSNMELLRIAAMILVLIVHASFKALGAPTLPCLQTNPISTFFRFFSESISIISVNVFVLISGWYGVKMRYSRLLAFLFQVYCLNIIMHCIMSIGERETDSMNIKSWLNLCDQYWFVKAYIILYILAPILNTFTDKASKKQVRQFLIAFFSIQTIIGFVWVSDFSKGYSALSFIGLYILARYIRLYPVKYVQLNKYTYLTLYLIATVVTTATALLLFVLEKDFWRMYSYCSPFVIFASVNILLFFSKISIQSKIVNWVAISCFAAYVVHCSPIFFSTYLSTIKDWFDNVDTLAFLLYTTLWIAGVFIMAILLDKIRIFIWELITELFLKTKELCNHS